MPVPTCGPQPATRTQAVTSPVGAVTGEPATAPTPRHDGQRAGTQRAATSRRRSTPTRPGWRKIRQPRTCTGGARGTSHPTRSPRTTPNPANQPPTPTAGPHSPPTPPPQAAPTHLGLYRAAITNPACCSNHQLAAHVHAQHMTMHVDCYWFTLPNTHPTQHAHKTAGQTLVPDNHDYPSNHHSKHLTRACAAHTQANMYLAPQVRGVRSVVTGVLRCNRGVALSNVLFGGV